MNRRNLDIFECVVIEEMTYEETGNWYNLSRERIRQIVAKTRRLMLHPSRLGVDHAPDGSNWILKDMRDAKAFWSRQLSKMRVEIDATQIN